MQLHTDERELSRVAMCRAAYMRAPALPTYPLSNLDTRRLRLLAMWESEEALKQARAAGVPTP